jgi:hypothetical protein
MLEAVIAVEISDLRFSFISTFGFEMNSAWEVQLVWKAAKIGATYILQRFRLAERVISSAPFQKPLSLFPLWDSYVILAFHAMRNDVAVNHE